VVTTPFLDLATFCGAARERSSLAEDGGAQLSKKKK